MSDNDTLRLEINALVADVPVYTGSVPNQQPGPPSTTMSATVRQTLQRRRAPWRFSDGGTAATAVTEEPILSAQNAIKVIAVYAMFPVAVTANASNLATVIVQQRNATGGGALVVAQNSTNTSDTVWGSNIVAFQPYSMTLTVANVSLAAGFALTGQVTKTGTGVALASATAAAVLTVLYEET